jgi:hypothetical protein
LLNDYQNGVFSELKPNPGGKIVIAKNMIVVAPEYGNDNTDRTFAFKDKNNINMIYATSNHINYEVYLADGGKLPIGGRCDWCKEDFSHQALGYPIAQQEQSELIDGYYRVQYNFWVEGEFCCFECALAELRRSNSQPLTYRDVNIRDSESMLKTLFLLTYPDENILQPAKHFRLLKSRKGSMDIEEWKNSKHKYFRTERVLLMPAKVEYLQY